MELIHNVFGVFQKGGPVMYVLLVCSFVVVAVAVERFLYYRDQGTDTKTLLTALVPALEKGEWNQALLLCRQTPGAAAHVAAQGIESYLKGSLYTESVLEGEASLAAARLRDHLNQLDMIVTLAPLLGLLGTVIGMIGSFSVLNLKAGQPLAITGGVGEALIATAAGLTVATAAMVVHSYFAHRLDSMITGLEEVGTVLVSYMRVEKRV